MYLNGMKGLHQNKYYIVTNIGLYQLLQVTDTEDILIEVYDLTTNGNLVRSDFMGSDLVRDYIDILI